MSSNVFAILCFFSFVIPIPLLVWLDRPLRGPRKKEGA